MMLKTGKISFGETEGHRGFNTRSGKEKTKGRISEIYTLVKTSAPWVKISITTTCLILTSTPTLTLGSPLNMHSVCFVLIKKADLQNERKQIYAPVT